MNTTSLLGSKPGGMSPDSRVLSFPHMHRRTNSHAQISKILIVNRIQLGTLHNFAKFPSVVIPEKMFAEFGFFSDQQNVNYNDSNTNNFVM